MSERLTLDERIARHPGLVMELRYFTIDVYPGNPAWSCYRWLVTIRYAGPETGSGTGSPVLEIPYRHSFRDVEEQPDITIATVLASVFNDITTIEKCPAYEDYRTALSWPPGLPGPRGRWKSAQRITEQAVAFFEAVAAHGGDSLDAWLHETARAPWVSPKDS